MVHSFIREEMTKNNGYSKSECFRIMGVSSSGYYSWIKRKEAVSEMKEEELIIMKSFKEIVKKLCFIPGKRTFHTHMWRDYGMRVSIKRCGKIMKKMHLVANQPKKDAYKGQATHFHEGCAKYNFVAQDFKIGPRKVILTDITYLYYGKVRTVCYLCSFKDAFTNEILGYDVSSTMDAGLVKAAYEMMMKNHRDEIKTKECYIHSDQGSQYLSTEFQRILSDDGFIQSMSARGNSQDNAPMESFFGRMKTEIIDIIALCPDLETAKRLISGYMDTYNNKRYQYALAGLTPVEYYQYMMTGVYPLDNYFGVEATELLSVSELVEQRQKIAREKARKRRAIGQKKREERAMLSKSALSIISRDQKKLRKEMKKWEQSEQMAKNQLKKLEKVFKKTKEAARFVISCSNEVKESLRNPLNWQNYPELDYINDIGDLY